MRPNFEFHFPRNSSGFNTSSPTEKADISQKDQEMESIVANEHEKVSKFGWMKKRRIDFMDHGNIDEPIVKNDEIKRSKISKRSTNGQDKDIRNNKEYTEQTKSYCELKNELETINKSYDKKLEELNQWKKRAISNATEKYNQDSRVALDYRITKDGKGTNEKGELSDINRDDTIFYHYSLNQFNITNGTTACTPISLVCCYNYLVTGFGISMEKYNWDAIVSQGAKVWSHYKSTKSNNNYQHIQELLKIDELQSINENIELVKEIGGHLDDEKNTEFEDIFGSSSSDSDLMREIEQQEEIEKAFYTIKEALENICSYDTRIAASVTVRGTTFTIMCDTTPPKVPPSSKKRIGNEDSDVESDSLFDFLSLDYLKDVIFWIFDSHGGTKERRSDLIRFKGLEAILKYIRKKYPANSNGTRSSRKYNRYSYSLEDDHTDQYSMVIFRRKHRNKITLTCKV
jgi:hypothetical protein